MLALTRKKNETVIIDGNIEVKVLEVLGDKVKLGISAPKEMDIYREEVYVQVLESNQKASHTSLAALKGIKKMVQKKSKKD